MFLYNQYANQWKSGFIDQETWCTLLSGLVLREEWGVADGVVADIESRTRRYRQDGHLYRRNRTLEALKFAVRNRQRPSTSLAVSNIDADGIDIDV